MACGCTLASYSVWLSSVYTQLHPTHPFSPSSPTSLPYAATTAAAAVATTATKHTRTHTHTHTHTRTQHSLTHSLSPPRAPLLFSHTHPLLAVGWSMRHVLARLHTARTGAAPVRPNLVRATALTRALCCRLIHVTVCLRLRLDCRRTYRVRRGARSRSFQNKLSSDEIMQTLKQNPVSAVHVQVGRSPRGRQSGHGTHMHIRTDPERARWHLAWAVCGLAATAAGDDRRADA